ncbi:MAG: rod shape-determining protein MreD, partial [Candidatus Saccharicenans sp.]
HLEPALIVLINTFSILVMFTALSYGELDGAIMGSWAGLVQDAFAHGVFGLAGLSQTISGFLAGWLSRKLDLSSFYQKVIFVFFCSLVQMIIWVFFYFLIFRKSLIYTQPLLYLQPAVTALLTASLITLLKKLKWTG